MYKIIFFKEDIICCLKLCFYGIFDLIEEIWLSVFKRLDNTEIESKILNQKISKLHLDLIVM